MWTLGTIMSSARGRQMLAIRAGKASARSPKHYPIELVQAAWRAKRAARLALQQQQQEQAGTLAEAAMYGIKPTGR